MIHFVGELHQLLHDEVKRKKGGSTRHVIFPGHPDNLHWVWDARLLQHINRNPAAFAAVLVLLWRRSEPALTQKGPPVFVFGRTVAALYERRRRS